ncbi:MAG: hypothetical protein A2Y24_04675 [Clostridiales bacterium GWE2_32_10]|nr:MAG: hypothetical protein A2Y24_04675 [Clostridiales bacterium GWE2_32_10]HBY21563.1 hypothetical protein [Clostridiales bacterium]
MGKSAFEGELDRSCYNKLYKEMQKYIEDNCDSIEFHRKSNFVREVQFASLEEMGIERVTKIQQNDDNLTFNVIVSCDIEIEETVSRNRETDGVNQWFIASCSADFDGELKNFKVNDIGAYN